MSKKTLLSFVGTNDAGLLIGQKEGAIITALTNEAFDEVVLIWNKGKIGDITYYDIMERLKKVIKKLKLSSKTTAIEMNLLDVTDHNSIYLALKELTDSLPKDKNINYTAAISSGTPAMQVCWILLAESGDFSENNALRLIKVRDPKFGVSGNIEVKLNTSLPQILRLKVENEKLINDLVPCAFMYNKKPGLFIGETEIPLSPIELSYYHYFAERNNNNLGWEKYSGFVTSNCFLERVIELHKLLYPDLESNRMELINIKKKGLGLSISTFRGNISKINKKIRTSINNKSISDLFEISTDGNRGAKFYGIKAPKEKIKLLD